MAHGLARTMYANRQRHLGYLMQMIDSSRYAIFNQNMVYYNHILVVNNQLWFITTTT